MTKRAVIYSRYSTDLQSDMSIEAQEAVCEKFAKAKGFQIVGNFSDRATSGEGMVTRLGLRNLMSLADKDMYDVVISESPSRISRDDADLPAIRKRLAFLDIEIIPVSSGLALDTISTGMHAIMGKMYVENVRREVLRGMTNKAEKGLNMGGKVYGYQSLFKVTHNENDKGKLVVVEEEAQVVRQIFEWYADEVWPRQIAYRLNEAKIPAPRGLTWNASTINGSKKRANGILGNEKYVGNVVWNRVAMKKNPSTDKRISRPQLDKAIRSEGVIEQPIISKELWDKVQAVRAQRANVQSGNGFTRKPKRMLSGLLKCGCCGSGMSGNGKDKSGRERIRCTRHAESGTCPDSKTHYLDTIESWVLAKLTASLSNPKLVEAYVAEYREERKRLAADATKERTRLTKLVADSEAKAKRITMLLVEGKGDIDMLSQMSKDAADEARKVKAELERFEVSTSDLVLQPNEELVSRYLEAARSLQAELARGAKGDDPAMLVLREIIDKVVVDSDGTCRMEGRLAALTGGLEIPGPFGVGSGCFGPPLPSRNQRLKCIR